MQQIIFWIFVIICLFWTYESIVALVGRGNTGKKTMIIPSVIMCGAAIYFYLNPDISKYHILWVAPAIILAEMVIFTIIVRLRK